LETLFDQAQSKSKIFARPGIQIFEVSDLVPPESLVHAGLMAKFHKRIGRGDHVGKAEKSKWALYKRKELDGLVEDIFELVDQLERVLPMSIEPSRTLRSLLEVVEETQQLAIREAGHDQVTPLQVAETMYEVAEGLVDIYR
jgi:hypothetical protein